MQVKERLIDYFEHHRGEVVSGAELSARLGVSRNAIWKAVELLRTEGYRIDSASSRGYVFSSENGLLSGAGIAKYLASPSRFWLEVHGELPSTNETAKERAREGAGEGTVVLARRQTAGRGRFGRRFDSEDGGVYLSVILRPSFPASDAVFVTAAAAVAMAEAIGTVAGKEAEIKWVNDVFVDGKKVCGILTEGAMNAEFGTLDYVVLGVGFNVDRTAFPTELANIAGNILSSERYLPDAKNALTAAFLDRFFAHYDALPEKTFLAEYRRRSLLTGKHVTVHRGEQTADAQVLGIDEACRLLVRYADGREDALSSGEVSVRTEER